MFIFLKEKEYKNAKSIAEADFFNEIWIFIWCFQIVELSKSLYIEKENAHFDIDEKNISFY